MIIKSTPTFTRIAKKLLTQSELEELCNYLLRYPDVGKMIKNTHGVRKLRWKSGKDNKGKSGGIRVLYHYSKNLLILLITVYRKSEKENITQAQCNELKQLIPKLVAYYKED